MNRGSREEDGNDDGGDDGKGRETRVDRNINGGVVILATILL